MYILDTDCVTLVERADSADGQRLRERLAALPPEEKATTIVSFEEQTRGWLGVIHKARKMDKLIDAYRRLHRHLTNYCQMLVLAFDEAAATRYQALKKALPREGDMDLKIAAIVLTHDAILLTRNVQHFRKVPGLRIEDWTR